MATTHCLPLHLALHLPAPYVVAAPLPATTLHTPLGLHPTSITIPGVPAVYASPPLQREKREGGEDYEDEVEEEPFGGSEYVGAPYGALALNTGAAYGALAAWSPPTPYGALGAAALPYSALQPYSPPSGCSNPLGWNIPCTLINSPTNSASLVSGVDVESA